jgi:putative transposase
MPRTARAVEAGGIYHVINRGNGRAELFHKDADYLAFLHILAQGLTKYDVKLLGYCLMPDHWHLLLVPETADALGRYLGWVGVTHVRRHHEHYQTRGGGHLYQGRFKSFPVQSGHHLRSVACYVEANARRARLVKKAQAWPWSSAFAGTHEGLDLPLTKWPGKPKDWLEQLNTPLDDETLKDVRQSVNRGKPLGSDAWTKAMATRLGLEHTLRGPGRPRKK